MIHKVSDLNHIDMTYVKHPSRRQTTEHDMSHENETRHVRLTSALLRWERSLGAIARTLRVSLSPSCFHRSIVIAHTSRGVSTSVSRTRPPRPHPRPHRPHRRSHRPPPRGQTRQHRCCHRQIPPPQQGWPHSPPPRPSSCGD